MDQASPGSHRVMKATPRLLVAGLDGATWEVLQPLLDAGRLPTLAGLIARGCRGTLRSVWPPISAAAWVSMITGMNPGRHGVFDFRNLDLALYSGHDEELASSLSYGVPTLFDYVGWGSSGQPGQPVIAYNVPLTYPPWPVNGCLVAGYPTPDRRRAYTHPPELARRLGPLETHSADQVGRARPEKQAEIYRRSMASMTTNLIQLARSEPWQLLMFVNGATDGAQHRFFKFVTPGYPGVHPAEQARHGELLAAIMIEADRQLGRLLAELPQELNVLVISDHGGMARPRRAFQANAWLAQEGWLRPKRLRAARQRWVEGAKQRVPLSDWAKRALPASLRRKVAAMRAGSHLIDWSHTQAYRVKLSHPIEGIHLNLQGRQKQGIVPSTSYERLREAIIARLRHRPELLRVARREELFDGPFLERAPDILFRLAPEFDGAAGLEELVVELPASWLGRISGYHTLDGILVAAGPDCRQGQIEGARLIDIAPTALYLLGQPVPGTMDGRVLAGLLRQPRAVPSQPGWPSRQPPARPALDQEEMAGIRDALRNLGYIE